LIKNNYFNLYCLILIGAFFLLLFDYETFIYIILLLVIIYLNFFKNHKNDPIVKLFSYLSVPIFYSLKYIFSTSTKFDNYWMNMSQKSYGGLQRFWDIQQMYFGINCNSDTNKISSDGYTFLFGDISKSCPFDIGWGPLVNNLSLNINVWDATLYTGLIGLVLVLFTHRIILKKSSDNFLTSIIFISPPVNFVFERMNIDLFIFLIAYLILVRFEKNYIFKGLIFSILILIKSHPIGFIPGLIMYGLYKKNATISLYMLFIGTISSIAILFYSDTATYINSKVYVNDFGRSFGLLGNYEVLNFIRTDIGNTKLVIFFTLYLLLLFAINLQMLKNFKTLFTFKMDYLTTSVFTWFLFVSLFENFDYRIAFIIILSGLVGLDKNRAILTAFFIYIFLSPLNIYGESALGTYNILFYIIKNLLFHSILLFMVLNLLRLFKLSLLSK